MFKIEQYVVYRKEVCQIKQIKEKNNTMYYILQPIDDDSLTIQVPTDNCCGYLRSLISKQDVLDIIQKIPSVPTLEYNDRLMENTYKNLMNTGNLIDYIKIIKTTYLRNQERMNQHKKVGDKDLAYFQKAEKYLYNEFSVVLGLNFEQTKEYVVNKVKEVEA